MEKGLKRVTKDFMRLLKIVRSWGWMAAVPSEEDPRDEFQGIIIGSKKFILKTLKDDADKFFISYAHEEETH